MISGTGNVGMSGSGTVALTGLNTYSGVTTLTSGTLNVGALAPVNTASAIGHGSVAGSPADLVINGGTLQYTGSVATSTNRLFTIGVAGATLDASGTASGGLTLGSGGGAIAFTGSAIPATLNLVGSGTGSAAGILAAGLGDSGTGANVTSLNKSGNGTWRLAADNTFTGGTTIAGGKLYLNGANATPSIFVGPNTTLGGSGTADAAAVTVAGSGSIEAGFGRRGQPHLWAA